MSYLSKEAGNLFEIRGCACSSPGVRKLGQRKLIQAESKSSSWTETGFFRLKVRLTTFPKCTHANKLLPWMVTKAFVWRICIKYFKIHVLLTAGQVQDEIVGS